MRLEKSKKSAVILSAAGVLCFVLMEAILNLLLPYLLTGDIRRVIANPESFSQPDDWLVMIPFFVLVLAAMIGIGAYWIYRFFGEQYYGRLALRRWGLFGLLLALFLKIPEWILPPGLWLLTVLLQFLGLFVAFFLTRWFFPTQPKGLHSQPGH